jgi:AcrR family transcriptional regulator
MTGTKPTTDELSDGRVARGARTRDAIVDGLLGLLNDGKPSPGAREIAARAGVSLRTVFQHFDDIESLYTEVAARQEERIREFLVPVDPLAPLSERVERIVHMRDAMFALVAPVRRSVTMHRSSRTSKSVRQGLMLLQRAQRNQIAETFPKELDGDERRLLQIDVWLSFETWDQFTSQHGLSRAATRGHLQSLLISLLV